MVNDNGKFDADNFRDYLAQTCGQRRAEGRALAYAFIVYDFDNHTITDILGQKNYWSALDKGSGKVLSIFYIDSRDSYYEERQKQIHQDALRRVRSSSSKMLSYLTPVAMEPTPTDNAIGLIKSTFEIDKNIKTPFVIFFQIDNNGDITDSFIVGLKQDRLEDAFLELKNHIRNAVESLNDLLPENYGNHQEIFTLIKQGVEGGKFNDFVSKVVKSKLGAIETIVFSFVNAFCKN